MRTGEMLAEYDLRIGTAKQSAIRRAWLLADDGGTIQAADAVALFGPARPEMHTAIGLREAMLALGAETW